MKRVCCKICMQKGRDRGIGGIGDDRVILMGLRLLFLGGGGGGGKKDTINFKEAFSYRALTIYRANAFNISSPIINNYPEHQNAPFSPFLFMVFLIFLSDASNPKTIHPRRRGKKMYNKPVFFTDMKISSFFFFFWL